VTTDSGQPSARPDEAVPRQRSGAHAASRGGWCRRKSAESPEAARSAALPMLSAPVAGDLASKAGSGGFPGSLPPSRAAATAVLREPPGEFARTRAATVRSSAVVVCAVAIVAAVVPLSVLQIPDAFAWSLPPRVAGAGPDAVASLLRASGLALPAMAVAAPLGALAVRRLRPGPVLLAGLGVSAAADVLGGSARTVALIGVDRSLHGLGAGVAMAAVAAIVSGSPAAGRSLAGWWAAVTVAGLAAAAGLTRDLVTSGDWHAALQPYPGSPAPHSGWPRCTRSWLEGTFRRRRGTLSRWPSDRSWPCSCLWSPECARSPRPSPTEGTEGTKGTRR